MKKVVLVLVAVATSLVTFGCAKDETICTQKVYKKDGAEWILINEGSWEGPEQYKNYTRTIRYQDGSFDVIKTIVTCD